MTPTTKLSQECIAQKKVAELKSKQAITALNAQYKVEKLEKIEREKAEAAARKEARAAEIRAAQAKYASRR